VWLGLLAGQLLIIVRCFQLHSCRECGPGCCAWLQLLHPAVRHHTMLSVMAPASISRSTRRPLGHVLYAFSTRCAFIKASSSYIHKSFSPCYQPCAGRKPPRKPVVPLCQCKCIKQSESHEACPLASLEPCGARTTSPSYSPHNLWRASLLRTCRITLRQPSSSRRSARPMKHSGTLRSGACMTDWAGRAWTGWSRREAREEASTVGRALVCCGVLCWRRQQLQPAV
jgi:hypothetical protein